MDWFLYDRDLRHEKVKALHSWTAAGSTKLTKVGLRAADGL